MKKAFIVGLALLIILGIFIVFQFKAETGRITLPGYNAEIEATVLSVEQIDLDQQKCLYYFSRSIQGEEPCPRDKAIIRISSVKPINTNSKEILLNTGEEIPVYFEFSARPAKLFLDAKKVKRTETQKDGSVFEYEGYEIAPTEIKGSYIVYHFAPGQNFGDSSIQRVKSSKENITLSGIKQDDKIVFITWVLPKGNGGIATTGSQLFDVGIYKKI